MVAETKVGSMAMRHDVLAPRLTPEASMAVRCPQEEIVRAQHLVSRSEIGEFPESCRQLVTPTPSVLSRFYLYLYKERGKGIAQ